MNRTHECRSPEDLIGLAKSFGQELKGGEVLALIGDLGLGKTTFVKGLALGIGVKSTVTSPTFNLMHRYRGEKLQLVHYDLYRIKKMEEIEALDLETELLGEAIVAIEWPQLIASILPSRRTLWIEFEEIGDSTRRVTIGKRS